MDANHPNVALIHEFFRIYASNETGQLGNVLAEDIEWHIPGKHSLAGTKIGIPAVVEYLNQLSKAAFQASPIVMGVSDQYVIDCHRNWSNLECVANLDNMSCLLWKIENGKIVEVYNFPEDQHKVDAFFGRFMDSWRFRHH